MIHFHAVKIYFHVVKIVYHVVKNRCRIPLLNFNEACSVEERSLRSYLNTFAS